jgi:hypothetical protein
MSRAGVVSRAASLLIALVVTGAAIWNEGMEGSGIILIFLIPLCLIWFPETIGRLGNVYETGQIRRIIPPVLISFMGWFFLVGLPLLIWLLMR